MRKEKENVIMKIIRKRKIYLQYCTIYIKKDPHIGRPATFKSVLFKGKLYVAFQNTYMDYSQALENQNLKNSESISYYI